MLVYASIAIAGYVRTVFCTFLCTLLLAHVVSLESHHMYVVKVLSSLDCLYIVSLLFQSGCVVCGVGYYHLRVATCKR